MTTQPSYAGEFFDLSITSINNDYGALHNIGVMLYGINFPLEKFIKELEMILNDEGGGATDDKAQKRQKRLDFLQHCDTNIYLKVFFQSFCNYLNGKDGSGEQYPNFIVITAAGGNIIIVFAQLIMNIINAYKAGNLDLLLRTNKILLAILESRFPPVRFPGVNINTIITSIVEHFTTDTVMLEKLSQIESSEASDCDFKLSPNIFQTRDQESEFVVDQLTSRMTDLDIDDSPQDGGGDVNDYIQQINDKITQLISKLDTSAESEKAESEKAESEFEKAESESEKAESESEKAESEKKKAYFTLKKAESEKKKASFTLKKASLTLIIELLLHVSRLPVSDEKKKSFTLIIDIFSQVIFDKDTSNAGFLLFRAKTLIDCRENYNPPYTPTQLKGFKKTCLPKYQNLYPQIIQQKHLDEVVAEISKRRPTIDPKTHPCFIYLNHLMEKKKAIKDSTQYTIDQIIKLFVAGYFKQANKAGHMAPLIVPSIYKTEALIDYTRNITSNINDYIYEWFRVRITPHGAPAKRLLKSQDYDYKSLVKLFSSLDSIIKNNSLIPLLGADIMNYFINGGSFHTETILDEIIKNFNADRRAASAGGDCVMLPSDILLVPTGYQLDLSKIKDVFNNILNVGLGYPDGLRITINAIITEKIKDIKVITDKLKLKEIAQQSIEYKEEKSFSGTIISKGQQTKSLLKPMYSKDRDSQSQGGKKYYKKNITFKKKIVKKTNEKLKTKSKKTRRQKNLRKVTLKHKKPRKHKSIKHKYRKHKL